MRGHQSERLARWAGLAIGVVVMSAVVVAARVPAGRGSIGADVTVVAVPAGTLALDHPGEVLQVDDMRPREPGEKASKGSFRVTNISDHRVRLHLHALPSTKTLDDILHVRVRARRSVLLRGTVGVLGGWSPRSILLGPGGSAEVVVAAWLPSSASAYQGAIEDVSVEFHARRVGG
jgi:hypothetical protein